MAERTVPLHGCEHIRQENEHAEEEHRRKELPRPARTEPCECRQESERQGSQREKGPDERHIVLELDPIGEQNGERHRDEADEAGEPRHDGVGGPSTARVAGCLLARVDVTHSRRVCGHVARRLAAQRGQVCNERLAIETPAVSATPAPDGHAPRAAFRREGPRSPNAPTRRGRWPSPRRPPGSSPTPLSASTPDGPTSARWRAWTPGGGPPRSPPTGAGARPPRCARTAGASNPTPRRTAGADSTP